METCSNQTTLQKVVPSSFPIDPGLAEPVCYMDGFDGFPSFLFGWRQSMSDVHNNSIVCYDETGDHRRYEPTT